MAFVGVSACIRHLGFASAVVAVVTHVLCIMFTVRVRATEDFAPFSQRSVSVGLIIQVLRLVLLLY